jgi:hypothetical protein
MLFGLKTGERAIGNSALWAFVFCVLCTKAADHGKKKVEMERIMRDINKENVDFLCLNFWNLKSNWTSY